MDLSVKRNQPAVSSTSVEPQFPPEVWEVIFSNLLVHHLLRVRLTCRNWRQIVDGCPALKAKILVRFPKYIRMDRHYEPVNLYSAPNADFRTSTIIAPLSEHWWPPFAANLSSIKLGGCLFSLRTLLWLLRHTPNLQQLQFQAFLNVFSRIDAPVDESDFRLDKMERLDIFIARRRPPSQDSEAFPVVINEMLDIFGKVFPRLKSLKLSHNLKQVREPCNVISLLRSTQHSLEELVLHAGFFSWISAIQELDQLRLRRLSFHSSCQGCSNVSDVLVLLRLQPTLEWLELKVELSIEDLCNIGRSLPNLKYLKVAIAGYEPTIVPSFLETMIGLKEFRYSAQYANYRLQSVDFQKLESPNLQSLNLHGIRILPKSLQRYLLNAPNIRSILLSVCNCPSWTELFSAIGQTRNLQYLLLGSVNVDSRSDQECFPVCIGSLRRLTLDRCDMPKRALMDLFQQCTNLVELKLRFMDDIDDAVFLLLCQRMKRLRKLEIVKCSNISNVSAFHIIRHCLELELLTVEAHREHPFLKENLSQIQSQRRVTVAFVEYDRIVGYL